MSASQEDESNARDILVTVSVRIRCLKMLSPQTPEFIHLVGLTPRITRGRRPPGESCSYPSASTRTTTWPDSHKIVVGYGTDVAHSQCDERRGSARRCHELNLDAVWFIDLDDSAEIAAPEPVIRYVTF